MNPLGSKRSLAQDDAFGDFQGQGSDAFIPPI